MEIRTELFRIERCRLAVRLVENIFTIETERGSLACGEELVDAIRGGGRGELDFVDRGSGGVVKTYGYRGCGADGDAASAAVVCIWEDGFEMLDCGSGGDF
jgi:hypothetical protein